MKKVIKWIILLLLILVFSLEMSAIPDVQINLRIYEGFRKAGNLKPSVTTSYSLKPIFSGNLVLNAGITEEKNEIRKIFNLVNLKMITKAQWGWKYGKSEKQFRIIILNGHEFIVQLTLLKRRGNFRLEVIEKFKTQKNSVLETEVVLPQKKSSVFGFEDSTGKPYFLAFERKKDRRTALKKGIPIKILKAVKRPKLIKRIRPKYPKLALKSKIGGEVVLEAVTDMYGRVNKVRVIAGHSELRWAAIDAVKQWIYEPYIINGIPSPVMFNVTVKFSLHKDKKRGDKSKSKIEIKEKIDLYKKAIQISTIKKPKILKMVEPKYPPVALKLKIEGNVILEAVTDIYGSVVVVKVIEGHPELFKAAVAAVKQWVYSPYIVDGKPKPVKFKVTVKFSLKKDKK